MFIRRTEREKSLLLGFESARSTRLISALALALSTGYLPLLAMADLSRVEPARSLRQIRHPAVERTTSTLNLDSVKSVPGRHIRKDHGVGGLKSFENLNLVDGRLAKFHIHAKSFRAVVDDLQQ